MESIIENFYGDRAIKAAESIVGTEAQRERRNIEKALMEKLSGTFNDDQKSLYMKLEDAGNVCVGLAYDAIYKAGFLDGIAMGVMGATYRDRVAEARKDDFECGYAEGKAAGVAFCARENEQESAVTVARRAGIEGISHEG
jgi:hypothetical protein